MDEIRQDLLNRVRQMEKDGVVTPRHARELKAYIFRDAGYSPDEVERLLNAEAPVERPKPEPETVVEEPIAEEQPIAEDPIMEQPIDEPQEQEQEQEERRVWNPEELCADAQIAARDRENLRLKLAKEEHKEYMREDSNCKKLGLNEEAHKNKLRELEKRQQERRERAEQLLYKKELDESNRFERAFNRLGYSREDARNIIAEIERNEHRLAKQKLKYEGLRYNEHEYNSVHKIQGKTERGKTAKAKDSNAPKPVQPTVPGMK